MTKCYYASACGGDHRYHSWIGGTHWINGMESMFHCGIGGDFQGANYMVAMAIGIIT